MEKKGDEGGTLHINRGEKLSRKKFLTVGERKPDLAENEAGRDTKSDSFISGLPNQGSDCTRRTFKGNWGGLSIKGWTYF